MTKKADEPGKIKPAINESTGQRGAPDDAEPKGKAPAPILLGEIIVELSEALMDRLGGAPAVAKALGSKLRGATVANGVARVELDHS